MILDFEQNDTQNILDSLLFIAGNEWGVDEEQIRENMNKIAFHESKGDSSAIQRSDKAKSGFGPGRGLFQFEMNVPGKGQGGAQTAIKRLVEQLGYVPEFVEGLGEKNYDVSDLTPEQQQILFLGNLLQKPNIKDEKGNIVSKAGFYDTDDKEGYSDEELANFWATHHQAGTIPGTDEYDVMIKKFLSVMPFFCNN